MFEFLFAIVASILGVGVPLGLVVISIIAFVRSGRVVSLERRVKELEARLDEQAFLPPTASPAPLDARHDLPRPADESEDIPEPTDVQGEPVDAILAPAPASQTNQWELFVGQKALGWVAAVLLLFAVGFFLRYAYQNNWIGPVGRVAIAAAGGVALMVAGWKSHRRGRNIGSQMLSSTGIVVLYAATYSAFGFYQLLPQAYAAAFLTVVVVESMITAVLYRSWAMSLMAVLGGLATPVLLHSHHDLYVQLFLYLTVLNVAVALTLLLRPWTIIGSLSLLGTQTLFWTWYHGNYHPEKLSWALGFQVAAWLTFLLPGLVAIPRRVLRWEGYARQIVNALFWFTAFYVLLNRDYSVWMGTAAIVMAAIYTLCARCKFYAQPNAPGDLVAWLAIAVGFIAIAIPIQADANWVAFGWAATAAALWWFGVRMPTVALRVMSAIVAMAAVLRLLIFDPRDFSYEPFTPIFNEFALPSIGVAALILASVFASSRRLKTFSRTEQSIAAVSGLGAIALLWYVLSLDCHDYFQAWSAQPEVNVTRMRWLGQLSLSALWTVYASVVLLIGFSTKLPQLRWLSIGLFGVTAVKVVLFDTANLDQIYRILAFFILAIFMGLAALVYQRTRTLGPRLPESEESV